MSAVSLHTMTTHAHPIGTDQVVVASSPEQVSLQGAPAGHALLHFLEHCDRTGVKGRNVGRGHDPKLQHRKSAQLTCPAKAVLWKDSIGHGRIGHHKRLRNTSCDAQQKSVRKPHQRLDIGSIYSS